MLRYIAAGMIGVTLLAGRPAAAQQAQPGQDNVKRLEAELEKLRAQVADLQAALRKSKSGPDGFERRGPEGGGAPFGKKKEGKGPFGDGPPFAQKKDKGPPDAGGSGPKDGPPMAKKKDGKGPFGDGPPFARKDDKKGASGFGGGAPGMGFGPGKGPGAGGPPGMPGGFGGGGPPFARATESRGPGSSNSRDLERRLERIIDDLEDLRRDIRRR